VRTNHKLLDLFSGIGGFSLGAEQNGIETIGFVEKDEFCQKVLKKHWSDVPIIDDIRKVNGKDFGAATIISGGFPCQPFSVAGKREGTDDDRYLWDETIRVIRECKPRWFIGENVEGIINIQEGVVLRQVCDDLEKEGFKVQCLVIPASGIGAWHQRKRVWILAHSNSNRDRYEITKSNGEEKEIQREHRKKDSSTWKSIGADTHDVSNTNSRLSVRENEEVQARGNTSTISGEDVPNSDSKGLAHSNESKLCTSKQQRMDSNEKRVWGKVWSFSSRCSEQNKQQTWWEAQSSLCRNVNGISYELDKDRANRIKSLGNSIVPLIARELGLAIIKAETDG